MTDLHTEAGAPGSPVVPEGTGAGAGDPADGDVERRARVAWSRLAEPADPHAAALIARLGHVEALDAVRAGAVPEAERFAPRLDRLDVDTDLRVAARAGVRVVVPGEPEWPVGLDDLARPPHCLWVRGRLPGLGRSVAVVGARAATAYGMMQARDIAAGLAEHGWVVVSGAAFGIDAAAHEGALAVEGSTVAVLACGAERPYPLAHALLLDRIAEVGAVVSEMPPGSAPTRHRFLLRNRLIATMTTGTFVVEAAIRSGALNTARTAAEHGRPVGALPGPVTSTSSSGCHEAIRGGVAQLVTDAAEVGELLGVIGEDLAPERVAEDSSRDLLEADEARVLGILPAGRARQADDVAACAGLSLAETLAALTGLELAGFATRSDRGWRRQKP